jgi:hypothetical protein
MTITFDSWRWFSDFINQKFLDFRWYAFRGHASERWPLESTLDRALRSTHLYRSAPARTEHLERFVLAARGRRGPHPSKVESENDWWALGQHHGLATPLLDWTESPFVALYFAFADANGENAEFRAVWAVNLASVEEASAELTARHRGKKRGTRPPIVEVIRPMSDENARLVSQRGLFTRAPDGTPMDSWVQEQFNGQSSGAVLIKFRIPNRDGTQCLRFLNRMNINHLSLFPDLSGASIYCNFDLAIRGY